MDYHELIAKSEELLSLIPEPMHETLLVVLLYRQINNGQLDQVIGAIDIIERLGPTKERLK